MDLAAKIWGIAMILAAIGTWTTVVSLSTRDMAPTVAGLATNTLGLVMLIAAVVVAQPLIALAVGVVFGLVVLVVVVVL